MEKEKTKKPFYKTPWKIILLVVGLLIAAALIAAVGSNIIYKIKERAFYSQYEAFDIIQNMDTDSIETEGEITRFSSTMEDGTVIRFEGKNITVGNGTIEFTPDSTLFSLDAVGTIGAYQAHISENLDPENTFDFGGAYTFSSSTSVSGLDELIPMDPQGAHAFFCEQEGGERFRLDTLKPNFVNICSSSYSPSNYTVDQLTVYCDPAQKTTAIRDIALNTEFYPAYITGEQYDANRETLANLDAAQLTFYLIVVPDHPDANEEHFKSVWFVEEPLYTVGDLKDAEGNILDKATATVQPGTTLEVTVGDYTFDVDIPVVERYTGAQTMNDLVPYAFPAASGEFNTLVVPVIWADQTHMATDETLRLFREGLGRMEDQNGNVTDYSVTTDEKLSLSEYYDTASYGRMNIVSFMTDWYYSKENFADICLNSPTDAYANDILDWVKKTYPDMDWAKYDKDANGYVDSMIILNAGVMDNTDEIYIISYSGAIHYRHSYVGDYAGTQDDPRINTYVTVGYEWLQDDYSTLIHEFAHTLGLIDYYDVSYSGIDAVGTFDMQSGSYGDWNTYSKYAVGWIDDPYVVQGLESGESIEYTIGSSALTDDVIIIPAAGAVFDGPFSEYIMIDLFSDDGNNAYYTNRDFFELAGAAGVRISHVNASMEKRTLEAVSQINKKDKPVSYDIGTIHYPNSYSADGFGRYNIEVIQNGGDNTFTDILNLRTLLSPKDLFYAGDTFSVEDYTEFFYLGRMDDGSDFGYTVEIVSVDKDADGNPTATIRITAQ